MINLDDSLFIAKGEHRACYRHPDKNNLCIKVSFDSKSPEHKRELGYYKLLSKRNIGWDYLTRFHGMEQTNIGLGHLFDLVMDNNNQPSKTLEYYLKQGVPVGASQALLRLKSYLLKYSIVTKELNPKNIVCVNNGGNIEKAIIVDDIGNTEFLPISSYSSYFGRRKIHRKWRRFEEHLKQKGLALK
ncbi:YrbL family protein [Kangiella sp. TOML190]|uniref:YrbL family protein n=1 Tax=Kangiella sp. TOML190 TaxID=2931351 RepID=UPI0020413DD8|nr:YrbL family protein [Kangiella sp. TOML190]